MEMARLAPKHIAKLGLIDTGSQPRWEGQEANWRFWSMVAFDEGMKALADRWFLLTFHADRVADQVLMKPLNAIVMRRPMPL